jgi:hypothetical protein
MVKEGIDPDNAARASATIAEMNTARVHFDLSNALAIEARHRWLAWFATKHRLYGTYMMKLAIERPTIAAAAVEIGHWMEERNKRLGVSEYDKTDLVIPRADGSQYRFNLPVLMWFSEFPLESSLAIFMEEQAAWVGEKLTGYQFQPSPTPFGKTFTRADTLIIAFADVVSADKANIDTPEKLTEWLDALPESRRLRWRKLINQTRAESIQRGDNWTALQSYNELKYQVLKDESLKAFKFYSGSHIGAPELEIERLLKEYITLAETDEEAARKLMQDNPALAAAFNATMDPVEKEQLDDGFRLYNQFRNSLYIAAGSADDNNTLINDYQSLLDGFNTQVDTLLNPLYEGTTYNPTFAKYFGGDTPKEFMNSLQMLMPLIPPESVWAAGRAKTQKEKDTKYDELTNDTSEFKQALARYGILPGNTSSMLYQQLQDEYVNLPMSEFTGETDYQMVPYRAQTMARHLARGGGAGVFRADAFLDLVKERTFRKWLGQGIGGSGKPTAPWLGFLDDEKADLIGLDRVPGIMGAWRTWAEQEQFVKWWAASSTQTVDGEIKGISTSSTLYKTTYSTTMQNTMAQLAGVDGFVNEAELSKLKLHERLLVFGVAAYGDDPESQGMRQFLSICTDYWNELGRADNPASKLPGVGPTAQTARPIWDKYMQQVVALAYPEIDPKTGERDIDKPSEWWTMFRGTYPISKFGFTTKWKDASPGVMQLLWGPEDLPYDESIDFETAWYE